jgi:hypothetical protein
VDGASSDPVEPGVVGGPLPLTLRQAGIAAALILVVALGASLLLPVAAAVEARRIVPPGAVVVGRASFLPADGWVVVESAQDAAVVARAGTRMLVRYQPASSSGSRTTSEAAQAARSQLRTLTDTARQGSPEVAAIGGVRAFQTTTEDPGFLQALASPGTTGALAVVGGRTADVVVQAAGPATSFAPLSGQVAEMVTGLRLQEAV